MANEVARDLTPLARCQELRTLTVSRIPARSRSLAGLDHCVQLPELEISAPLSGADPAERDRLRRELPSIDIQ